MELVVMMVLMKSALVFVAAAAGVTYLWKQIG